MQDSKALITEIIYSHEQWGKDKVAVVMMEGIESGGRQKIVRITIGTNAIRANIEVDGGS